MQTPHLALPGYLVVPRHFRTLESKEGTHVFHAPDGRELARMEGRAEAGRFLFGLLPCVAAWQLQLRVGPDEDHSASFRAGKSLRQPFFSVLRRLDAEPTAPPWIEDWTGHSGVVLDQSGRSLGRLGLTGGFHGFSIWDAEARLVSRTGYLGKSEQESLSFGPFEQREVIHFSDEGNGPIDARMLLALAYGHAMVNRSH